MKTILIDVSSIDGKLTKWTGNNIYEWSSPEDFSHFKNTIAKNNLIVMGSGTFDKAKTVKKAGLKAEKGRLRIILTKTPQKYEHFKVPNQLEFSNESPKKLITRLSKIGFKQMLLVSGGRVSSSFFKEKLIDELWLTIEPKIFGLGEPLISKDKFNIELKLLSMDKLNSKGTILLKYSVLNNK